MSSNEAMAGALLTAFNAVLGVAAPARVVPVLRQALTTLLAEEQTPTSQKPATPTTLKRRRSHWTGDLEAWAPLRDRVLAVLAARNMSRRELAAAVKITYTTLKPSLLPKGRAPSKTNIARLQRWLKTMEARAVEEGRPAENAQPGAPAKAGELACPAYKLTAAQREKLAAYRQLDEQTARNGAGVTLEVIDEAVAGHSLAPEIVGRIVNFLQQQPAASGL